MATAEPIAAAAGLPLRVEGDLREVRRTNQRVLPREEYVALVARFLTGADVEGWESAQVARARFSACVERLARDADGPLAVVTHGLVLSLHLGYDLEKWLALRLPDVVETDV
jgi:broad specificity phosphatase PhoE